MRPAGSGRRRRFFGPESLLVTTRDGRQIRGLRRAEDSYTLLMTGLDGKLYRFEKRDLRAEKATPEIADARQLRCSFSRPPTLRT